MTWIGSVFHRFVSKLRFQRSKKGTDIHGEGVPSIGLTARAVKKVRYR